MEKKAKNVDFDFVRTTVELDTVENNIRVTKEFFLQCGKIFTDVQLFDLRVLSFSVAMQMACAFVQSSSLTEYE